MRRFIILAGIAASMTGCGGQANLGRQLGQQMGAIPPDPVTVTDAGCYGGTGLSAEEKLRACQAIQQAQQQERQRRIDEIAQQQQRAAEEAARQQAIRVSQITANPRPELLKFESDMTHCTAQSEEARIAAICGFREVEWSIVIANNCGRVKNEEASLRKLSEDEVVASRQYFEQVAGLVKSKWTCGRLGEGDELHRLDMVEWKIDPRYH